MIDVADVQLLDPELRDLLAADAINAALAYGQPGSPGWHKAMRADARRAWEVIRHHNSRGRGNTENHG